MQRNFALANLRPKLVSCNSMHGQKKRRKRAADGLIEIDGITLRWSFVSEPQWTSVYGAKGICFSVHSQNGNHRELVLEYPFQQPGKRPQFPQRPSFSPGTIEAGVRRAIAAAKLRERLPDDCLP
jgi:hypothetical protein